MSVALGTGQALLYLISELDPPSHLLWLPVPSTLQGPGEREGLRGLFIRAAAFWRQDRLGSLAGMATMASDL